MTTRRAQQRAWWRRSRRTLMAASWVIGLTMLAGGQWAFAVGNPFVGIWWTLTGIAVLPGGRS